MPRRLPLYGLPYVFVVVLWMPEWHGPPVKWRAYPSLAVARYRARRLVARPSTHGPRLVWIEHKHAPASS